MMKTRLDEVRRMQKLAGILSSNYRFLSEEEEPTKGEPSPEEAAKIAKNMAAAEKTLETMPGGKGSMETLKDPKALLQIMKSKLSPEQLKAAEERAKALEASGGDIKKAEAELAKKGDSGKEELNESLVATLVLLLPTILEAGGSLTNYIYQKAGLDKNQKAAMEEHKKLLEKLNDELKALKAQRKKGTGKSAEAEKALQGKADAQQRLDARKFNKQQADKEAGVKEDYKSGYEVSGENFDKELEDKIIAIERKIQRQQSIFSEKYRTKIGEKLGHAGHALHGAYTSPIRFALWVLGVKPSEKREKIANIIYAIGMLAYAFSVGLHQPVVASLKGMTGVSETIEVILNGVKGGASFVDTFKNAAAIVGK